MYDSYINVGNYMYEYHKHVWGCGKFETKLVFSSSTSKFCYHP